MLKTARLSVYRNAEILAFASNVLDVLTARNLAYLAAVQADLQVAHDAMSDAFKKESGSIITGDLKDLDKRRDDAIRGTVLVARGFEYHYDVPTQKAAVLVLRNIRKYAKNVATLSYQEETSAIKNIVAEWSSNADLTAAVTLLGLTAWQTELETANTAFDATFVSRSQSDAQKSLQAPVSELRKPVEDAFQTVGNHLTANLVVNPSQDLTGTVAEVNTLVDTYNLAVNRR
jgi:hypothetical protein